MFGKNVMPLHLACVAVLAINGPIHAQSFDEGSFENGSADASEGQASAPAGNAPSVSGFEESSFDDSGSVAANESASTPSQDASNTTGGGFDDGSFEPGGTSSDTAVALPEPVGGDDFPGGNVLPEPSGDQPVGLPAPTPSVPEPSSTDTVDPQITAFETRDFGVRPQNNLRQGQFHAPTPVAIPGATLVTTNNLVEAYNNGIQMVVIDVLGSDYSLPGAFNAPGLASAGSFNDRTQQQAAAWLQQITGGNRESAIVIFCSDPMCWLSYNGTLRTVAAGYTNVYWYRGGLKAWEMAGLPLRPAGF